MQKMSLGWFLEAAFLAAGTTIAQIPRTIVLFDDKKISDTVTYGKV